MKKVFDLLYAVLLGTVQGITEWLPISSTGHLILINEFLGYDTSMDKGLLDLFLVLIQFASVLAVFLVFLKRIIPYKSIKNASERKKTASLWGKLAIGLLPVGFFGILFENSIEKYLFSPYVVALALIVYGAAFLIVETKKASQDCVAEVYGIGYIKAFLIGAFQALSLVPGTSRSGATILGARMLRVSRKASAEFSFLLAIPVMLGASLLKATGFFLVGGRRLTPHEMLILVTGCATAFIVSSFAVKFLLEYVKNHSFKVFGIYRIFLGVLVLVYFSFIKNN